MVQLNPVPVFGGPKKYHYHLTEIFHQNFCINGKRSLIQLQKHDGIDVDDDNDDDDDDDGDDSIHWF